MAYLTGVGWCVYLAKEKAAARAKELEEAAAEAERVQEVLLPVRGTLFACVDWPALSL